MVGLRWLIALRISGLSLCGAESVDFSEVRTPPSQPPQTQVRKRKKKNHENNVSRHSISNLLFKELSQFWLAILVLIGMLVLAAGLKKLDILCQQMYNSKLCHYSFLDVIVYFMLRSLHDFLLILFEHGLSVSFVQIISSFRDII